MHCLVLVVGAAVAFSPSAPRPASKHLGPSPQTQTHSATRRVWSSSALGYHALDVDAMFADNAFSFNRSQYEFALVEHQDLGEVAELSMHSFYTPRIALSTDGLVGLSKVFWGTALEVYAVMDRFDARNSHYMGFRSRANIRLVKPGLYLSMDSVLLAIRDKELRKAVGVVEVCIEAPDGKLAPGFAFNTPWRTVKGHFQPYLCNLCVDSGRRRQGLGRVLCEVAERIAYKYWRKTHMFLHVEESNEAAQRLYAGMGYTLGPELPSWEKKLNGLENILYYTKDLSVAFTGAYAKEYADEREMQGLSMAVDDE